MNEPRTPGRSARILLALLGFYKKACSPYLPPACRFFPTCSQYASEAIEKYGVGGGLWRALGRVLKCHPLHSGGVDLVD